METSEPTCVQTFEKHNVGADHGCFEDAPESWEYEKRRFSCLHAKTCCLTGVACKSDRDCPPNKACEHKQKHVSSCEQFKDLIVRDPLIPQPMPMKSPRVNKMGVISVKLGAIAMACVVVVSIIVAKPWTAVASRIRGESTSS